jgi:hypothetical protein
MDFKVIRYTKGDNGFLFVKLLLLETGKKQNIHTGVTVRDQNVS